MKYDFHRKDRGVWCARVEGGENPKNTPEILTWEDADQRDFYCCQSSITH